MDNTASDLHAHRIQATLTQKGTLTLDHLPFDIGDRVEIIVLSHAPAARSENPYPLRGTPVHCQDPFLPGAEQEWEAVACRCMSSKTDANAP